jgi:hypothetical protein
MIIYCSFLLGVKNASDKSYWENENTHFVFNNYLFSFSKFVPFYEIMWKNIVESVRLQVMLMRFECWVTKATHTHTQTTHTHTPHHTNTHTHKHHTTPHHTHTHTHTHTHHTPHHTQTQTHKHKHTLEICNNCYTFHGNKQQLHEHASVYIACLIKFDIGHDNSYSVLCFFSYALQKNASTVSLSKVIYHFFFPHPSELTVYEYHMIQSYIS